MDLRLSGPRSRSFTMRLSFCTVICCCVLTAALPPVRGEEPGSTLRRRFKVWLQTHMRRDSPAGPVGADEDADPRVGPPPRDGDAALPPSSSVGANVRSRRSSKPSGCLLITCLFHDLVHQVHEVTNTQKVRCAPKDKIGSKGYGRRRRSQDDAPQEDDAPEDDLQTGTKLKCNEDAEPEERP
ncbi:pro-adrenomedullin-like isoform X2 [Cololabis saira]|uniref:pro-adrenomedullin-like isoform X2 n=1 Tax=Cololabis saira TaxID=129043 RepID=UPI002AD3CB14|nr:pro-adrenomedullin-like isoform X2 [Cololabis saira]